mmetsp:Transcript_82227/g.241422  ORF Transcript_82227/g.241422 Transcript_82227/m.241422 type:complete len:330 (+) Transcript_82227:1405-2394(+)
MQASWVLAKASPTASQEPFSTKLWMAALARSKASAVPVRCTFRSAPSWLGGTLTRQPVASESRWMCSPPLPMKAPVLPAGRVMKRSFSPRQTARSRCSRPCMLASSRRLASSSFSGSPLSCSVLPLPPAPFLLLKIFTPASREILFMFSPPLPMTLPTCSSGTSKWDREVEAPPAAAASRSSAPLKTSCTCSRAYSTHSSGPLMMMRRQSGSRSSLTTSIRAPLSFRMREMVSPAEPMTILHRDWPTTTMSAFGSPGLTSRAPRSVSWISRLALARAVGTPDISTARSSEASEASFASSMLAWLSRLRCRIVVPSFPMRSLTICLGTSI